MKNLNWLLLTSLLLVGCGGVPYDSSRLPADLVVNEAVVLPSDTEVAIYLPQNTLNFSYSNYASGEQFELGAAMGRAISDVNAHFFPNSFLTENNLHRQYGLLIDVEPQWEVNSGALELSFLYQVFDSNREVIHSGEQVFTEDLNYTQPDASFYNAAVRNAQKMYVDIVNSLSPEAEKYPAITKVSDVPAELLADMDTPVRSTTGVKLNRYGEILTTARATDGCLISKAAVDDELLDVVAVDYNSLLDISVLTTGADFANPIHFSRVEPLELGESVLAVSFNAFGDSGKGDSLLLSFGNVHAKEGVRGTMGVFQVSSAIRPGSSGAAVLDDQGNFIGFVNGNPPLDYLAEKNFISENVFFALKAEYVESFLDTYQIEYSKEESQEPENLTQLAISQAVQINCYQ